MVAAVMVLLSMNRVDCWWNVVRNKTEGSSLLMSWDIDNS